MWVSKRGRRMMAERDKANSLLQHMMDDKEVKTDGVRAKEASGDSH